MTYEVTEAVTHTATPELVFNPETGSFETATETEAVYVTAEGSIGDAVAGETIH